MVNTVTRALATVHSQALARASRQPVSSICSDGCGDVLFQLTDRTECQVDTEGVGQKRRDVAFAQSVGTRPQTQPGLHRGTEGAARYLFGPGGLAQKLALRAAQGVQLIFGNPSLHRRDVDHLVPLRMGVVADQRMAAVATRRRFDRYHVVDLLYRQKRASVPFVTRMAPRLLARRPSSRTLARSRARWVSLLSTGGRRPAATALSSLLQFGHALLQLRHLVGQRLYRLPQPAHLLLHRDGGALPIGIRNGQYGGLFHKLAGARSRGGPQLNPRYQQMTKKNSSSLFLLQFPTGLNGY